MSNRSVRRPLVSVVMTTYNGARFVDRTVQSILSQTLKDLELIVVDDSSTDDTFERLRSFKDTRLRLYRNDSNRGISDTRNRGLELALGEYVAMTDQDDFSMPARLERQVDYLNRNPDVVLLGSWVRGVSGDVLLERFHPETRPHVLEWILYTRSPIHHSAVCIRREVIHERGIRYRRAFHYAEDFVLYHECAEIGKLATLPEELVVVNRHGQNASILWRREMESNGRRYMLRKYARGLGLDLQPAEVEVLWSAFNLGRPLRMVRDLRTAGVLYGRALSAYVKAKALHGEQEEDVRECAAHEWWKVVAKGARAAGNPGVIREFWRMEALSARSPSVWDLSKTAALSVVRRLTWIYP